MSTKIEGEVVINEVTLLPKEDGKFGAIIDASTPGTGNHPFGGVGDPGVIVRVVGNVEQGQAVKIGQKMKVTIEEK